MRCNRVVIFVASLFLFASSSKAALLLGVSDKMKHTKINNTESTCLSTKSYFPIYEISNNAKNDDTTIALSHYLATVDRRQYKKWKSKCNRTGRVVPLPYDERVVKMWADAELKNISPSKSVSTKKQSAPSVPKERCLATIKADEAFRNRNFARAASLYNKAYQQTGSVVDLLNRGISEYNGMHFKRAYYTMRTCLNNSKALTNEMKQTAREIKDKALEAWNANRQEAANAISGIFQSAIGNSFGYGNGYGGFNVMSPPNPYAYVNSSSFNTYSNPNNIFTQNGIPTPEEYMKGARFNHQIPLSLVGTARGESMARTIRNNEIIRQNTEQFWKTYENNNKELNKIIARNFSEWHNSFVILNGREPNSVEVQTFFHNAYEPNSGLNMSSSQENTESTINMDKAPSGDYQIDYDHYAKIVELYYSSATLGHNNVNSSGDYVSLSSSVYRGSGVGENALLTYKTEIHLAQNRMRQIRLEATGKGITIQQSRWETAILK